MLDTPWTYLILLHLQSPSLCPSFIITAFMSQSEASVEKYVMIFKKKRPFTAVVEERKTLLMDKKNIPSPAQYLTVLQTKTVAGLVKIDVILNVKLNLEMEREDILLLYPY